MGSKQFMLDPRPVNEPSNETWDKLRQKLGLRSSSTIQPSFSFRQGGRAKYFGFFQTYIISEDGANYYVPSKEMVVDLLHKYFYQIENTYGDRISEFEKWDEWEKDPFYGLAFALMDLVSMLDDQSDRKQLFHEIKEAYPKDFPFSILVEFMVNEMGKDFLQEFLTF